MPYTNPEDKNANSRAYYARNKKKLRPKKNEAWKKWASENPEKRKEVGALSDKRYYQANKEELKEKSKWRWMAKAYGITKEQYEAMLAAQGGKCAICGATDPQGRNGHSRFCLDHDHKLPSSDPASHRGLLCTPCNVMLGNAKDDPAVLQKAAEYLRAQSSAPACYSPNQLPVPTQ